MALQARTEFAAAINQIASEKGIDSEVILGAIESAALAAYRKDLSFRNEAIPDDFEELTAKIDPASGEIGIYRDETNITPPGFARIAAQTAKQVIAQKLHEAEREAIADEFEQKIGSIVSGAISRHEGNTYFVDLGRTEGILPPSEQVRDEFYGIHTRMKFLIKEIRESGKGSDVILSRSDATLVKGLFSMEVPEMQSGAVEIREIAREAGSRTKVAVASSQEGVDPVGSLVGQKGVRVQAVIQELGEEKIDIIPHSSDPARFIAAALSPAKDVMVNLNEEEKVAKVRIADNELSLAIGKGGQNVRLAAKLTGWKIDIEGTGEIAAAAVKDAEDKAKAEKGTDENNEDSAPADDTSDDTTASVQTDDALVQAEAQVEAEIDKAVEEESVDGAIQVEPSDEAQAEAVADAEDDMAEDPEMNKDSAASEEKQK
jgi:N utilization substance protein A